MEAMLTAMAHSVRQWGNEKSFWLGYLSAIINRLNVREHQWKNKLSNIFKVYDWLDCTMRAEIYRRPVPLFPDKVTQEIENEDILTAKNINEAEEYQKNSENDGY